jgi:hypothetical protein
MPINFDYNEIKMTYNPNISEFIYRSFSLGNSKIFFKSIDSFDKLLIFSKFIALWIFKQHNDEKYG